MQHNKLKNYKRQGLLLNSDEPKESPKQTPEEPKATPTPAQSKVETPAQPKVETPVQPTMAAATTKLATPEPVEPQQQPQQELPQTGNEDENVAALLGLLALGVVGTASLPMRKKRYGQD